jgi:transposase
VTIACNIRDYDGNWFRSALLDKNITHCIPPTRSRKAPIAYDETLYRQRHKIENMLGRLKDWRRRIDENSACDLRRLSTSLPIAATPSP